MRILVTGSAGFIGARLVDALRARGHYAIGFSAEQGKDVLNFEALNTAVKGMDVVYHLAAVLDELKREEMRKVNVKGTENALQAAAKNDVKQFIYLSSVGVYGNFKGKADERSEIKPDTAYEKTKAEAEKLVWDYQEMVPVTIIRSALVMGANEYWKGIIKMIKKGSPIIGSAEQKWQTIYVDDLVDALVFVLGKEETFGEIYNVAEKDEPSLKEIYFEIKKNLGMEMKFKNVPAFLGMLLAYAMSFKAKISGKKSIMLPAHVKRLLKQRFYSTEKIQKLGFSPKYDMKKAVEKTVNELKEKNLV